MYTFQFSIEGWRGDTSENDHLVKWVNAPSRAALDRWLKTQKFKVDSAGIDDITQDPIYGITDGVDVILNQAGKVVEGQIGMIKPIRRRHAPLRS